MKFHCAGRVSGWSGRIWRSGLAIAAAASILLGGSARADEDEPVFTWRPGLCAASQMIDAPLQNKDGEEIGKIRDLLFNVENGHFVCAIGQVESMKPKLAALPVKVMDPVFGDDRKVVATRLKVEQGKLVNAPTFNKERWEHRWDEASNIAILRRMKKDFGLEVADRAEMSLMSVRDLLSGDLMSAEGDTFGDVEEVIVDSREGKVDAFVVASGGILGLGEHHRVVAWNDLKLHRYYRFGFSATEATMKTAPVYDGARFEGATSDVHSILRGSEFFGVNVKNRKGEELGEVTDLAFDIDRGRVAYAVVEFSGRLYPVPVQALTYVHDDSEFIVDIEKARLRSASGYASNEWPAKADRAWLRHARTYLPENVRDEYGEMDEESSNPFRIRSLDELIGFTVVNEQAEEIGEVEDFVFGIGDPKVRYIAVSVGGLMGIGVKLFAVSWDEARLEPGKKAFIVKADKNRLEKAKGFNQDRWPARAPERNLFTRK